MKIAVAGGHSKAAQGAVGHLNEYTEDRKVKNALIRELKNRGHSVVDCSNEKTTQNAELAEEVRLANASGAELFIAIHFNAGGGTGSECWYYSGSSAGKAYSERVASKMASALGLRNRGAKATKSLYVLRKTSMTAILPEVCFVDTKADANAYNKIGANAVAAAIADAVCNTNKGVISSTSASSGSTSGDKVSVDGWWGKKTTTALQRIYGTPVDGIVSNQDPAQKKYLLRADSGSWDFAGQGNGSNLIGAMQRAVGVEDDGFMGKNTVIAWQKKLGVTADGYMGVNTVTALQNWINKQ